MTNKIITTKLDIERLSEGIMSALSKPLHKFNDRLKRLEEREFPYKGVWQASNTYYRGNFVTQDGSLFHCNADSTRMKPGTGSDWTLAVKSGGK